MQIIHTNPLQNGCIVTWLPTTWAHGPPVISQLLTAYIFFVIVCKELTLELFVLQGVANCCYLFKFKIQITWPGIP